MTDRVIALDQVEVRIGTVRALPTTDLHLGRGEVLALMGPSGSGKTTLIEVVLALQAPTSGSVAVLGHDYSAMSAAERSRLRRRSLGVIAQNPQLLPELTVVENVAITVIFDGMARRQALQLGRRALAEVGLSGTAEMRPENLSGGEAQRVALARALVSEKVQLLVADEPTAALDEENVRRMTDLLVSTARARGISVLLATHDSAVAARCDRVQRLRTHRAHVVMG